VIIGVTGDTHNNLKNIKKICSIFNENGVDLVIHTGDISLPKSLSAFKDLNCALKAVLGNNDIEEKEGLLKESNNFKCEIFHEPLFLELKGIKIGVYHHPDLIDEFSLSENNLILHGHTHRYKLEKIKNCVVFNPGECAGMLKGKNQVGLIDLKNLSPEVIKF